MRNAIFLFVLLVVCLSTPSCTVVKPVTCAVVHPIVSTIDLFERAAKDDDSDEEYERIPGGLAVVELVIVLPVYYAYKTCVGTVGGLFTGFVSDLNVVTGHGDLGTSLDTLVDPTATNEPRRR